MPYYKPQHEVFIRGMLAHGDKIKAYRQAYPGISPTAVRQAANRLLSYPHIKQRIEIVMQRAREIATAEYEAQTTKRLSGQLLSVFELRTVLAGIIRGEYMQKKHIKLKGRAHEVYEDISAFAVLRAIELDCKLEAGYIWLSTPVAVSQQVTSLFRRADVTKLHTNPAHQQIETNWPVNTVWAQHTEFSCPPFLLQINDTPCCEHPPYPLQRGNFENVYNSPFEGGSPQGGGCP